VPLALLRAQERFGDYLRLTGLQVVFVTASTLLFVVVLNWGVTGWMLANAVGGLVLLGRGLALLRHKWTFEFDVVPLRLALSFGLPMIPHALAHWGLALSDRTILGAFVADAEIGAYYIAFQACIPITVLAIALSQASQTRYAEALTSQARREEVARMATVHVVITGLLAAAVAVIGPPLIRLLLPPAYAVAGDYLPWLALGSALFGCYLIPMNAVSVMRGRTERVWMITVLAAGLNISLNLALVPTMGAMAAAINTAVGYAALLAGVTIYMRAVCDPPIPYERARLAISVLVIALAGLVAVMLAPSALVPALIVQTAVLLVGAIVLVRVLFYRDAVNVYHGMRSRSSGVAR
jgi:O-antigen/teichoic acid export membrane protein